MNKKKDNKINIQTGAKNIDYNTKFDKTNEKYWSKCYNILK